VSVFKTREIVSARPFPPSFTALLRGDSHIYIYVLYVHCLYNILRILCGRVYFYVIACPSGFFFLYLRLIAQSTVKINESCGFRFCREKRFWARSSRSARAHTYAVYNILNHYFIVMRVCVCVCVCVFFERKMLSQECPRIWYNM
jgi:hypothetical protein